MARQKGIIKLTGTIGDITFVQTKDGYIAREKSGIDGKRIKTDPRFIRTRENGAEFGRAGKAGKVLRQALRTLIIRTADDRVTSRLTQQFMKVIQADEVNARGLRNVIDGEAELLTGFGFNIDARLETTFVAPYTAAIDRATGSASITIPAFNPSALIVAPPGATHCRLVSGAAVIDFEAQTHKATFSQSADIDLRSMNQAQLNLPALIGPNSTAPIFLAFGIEFYQQVNGQMYSLSNGAFNALNIVTVSGSV
jgi:hypothetical protein